MTISEKLNTSQRVRICGIDEIDILITELDMNDHALDPFRQTGLTIL
jgi:hypothetical protein